MAAVMHDVEVWVVVDADGDYAVGKDEDEATSAFEENVGGSGGRRCVRITVRVPLPKPIELTGVVVAVEEEGALKVA